MFVLYDYSFRPDGQSKDDALAAAYEKGVVCTDEMFLQPDPYPSREDWCWARVQYTEKRLVRHDSQLPLVVATTIRSSSTR